MRLLLACMMAAFLAVSASAQSRIVAVDGDTVRIDGVSWRLLGFDTPETRFARCSAELIAGRCAKSILQHLIDTAENVTPITDGRRDKYRRILGRLLIDGRDIADLMVERGLARRYNGGKREGWCSK